MQMLRFLCLVLAAIAASSAFARPNILLLMAEDMSPRVGAFGDEVAVTPNLDRLADAGVRFTQVYTAAGVCAPSRAAQITGMYAPSIGAQHMRSSNFPDGGYKAVPPPHVKAYPELLRAAGYYTFTDEKLDYQFSGPGANSGPPSIWNAEGMGADWRGRADDQPFFGLINFQQTHESGTFPPLGHWPHSAMHLLLQVYRAWAYENPDRHAVVAPADVVVPPYYPDTPTVRADIARHYNNIALMDKQVAALLQKLAEDGLAQDTIVIWTTDHGDGLPRAKRELFDSGLHVPLIIYWPEHYRPAHLSPGAKDARLISFIDLAPTILALASVQAPDYLPGQNFLDPETLPREFIYATRDRIDEVEGRQRAVRDQRYKYIRSWYPQQSGGHHLAFRDNQDLMRELWRLREADELNADQLQWFEPTGEEQLYDTWNDPHELTNLVSDPALGDVLERMREALAAWFEEHEDWSDRPEAQMREQFYPAGDAPATAHPEFHRQGSRLSVTTATLGASLIYRKNAGQWQLYRQPIEVASQDVIDAQATRYGWKPSAVITFSPQAAP